MGSGGGPRRRCLLLLALSVSCARALDAPAPAPTAPRESRPNPLLRGLRSAVLPPLKAFAQSPPITRSWVSVSLLMAVLTSTRAIDARVVCFSEPDVVHKGQWWRLLLNFFFMGDALKSIFFWVQLHHFWECCKMLELVKYRWEPGDFIKLILGNAVFLLLLKQLFPAVLFLGTPMVMAFLYMYSREYEMQQMNLFGFFSIRCGWLPFSQMLQDLVQAGDIGPNLLGLLSGHTYYFLSEVRPFLLLPERVSLGDLAQLCLHGTPLVLPEPPPSEAESSKEGGEEGGDGTEEAEPDGEAMDDNSRAADEGKAAAASE